jgi:DNA polymerase V
VQASANRRATYLAQTAIKDVWGIGWHLGPRLRAEGIHTALDLSQLRPQLAQQLMGIHGRQLVAELNGTCCYHLEPFGKVRQTIMHGRQFGEDTDDFSVIEAAIASLTARAAAGLRAERLLTRRAAIYLSTNRHKPGYQRLSRLVTFAVPTADTGHITSRLAEAALAAFNARARYHQAHILLYDLVGEQRLQTDLFNDRGLAGAKTTHARLQAFDSINSRYGRRTIRYAAEDLSGAWQPKRNHCSLRYTTNWQELPTAYATSAF